MRKEQIGKGAVYLVIALYFLAVPFGFFGFLSVALVMYLLAGVFLILAFLLL